MRFAQARIAYQQHGFLRADGAALRQSAHARATQLWNGCPIEVCPFLDHGERCLHETASLACYLARGTFLVYPCLEIAFVAYVCRCCFLGDTGIVVGECRQLELPQTRFERGIGHCACSPLSKRSYTFTSHGCVPTADRCGRSCTSRTRDGRSGCKNCCTHKRTPSAWTQPRASACAPA